MRISTVTNSNLFSCIVVILFLSACSEKGSKSDDFDINKPRSGVQTSGDKASVRVDLANKGVGPITNVSLDKSIDLELANAGKVIFELKCMACHKVEENFIGPALKGVMKRRSPEWVMNMILNPGN